MIQKISLVILLGIFGERLAAQTPAERLQSVEQVRALLQSSEAADQAWGAWRAGQGTMRELLPQLRTNLETHLKVNPWYWQDEAVIDSSLDALMQLSDSPLPIETLQLLYERRPAQSVILLSRMESTPEVNRLLLGQLDRAEGKGTGAGWFAVANVLLARQPTALVPALLRKLELRGHVVIHQPERNDFERITFSDSFQPLSLIPVGAGFPPWPTYTLEKGSSSGGVVAPGPVLITYRRLVVTDGPVRINMSEVFERWPTPAERLVYLDAAAPNTRIEIQAEEWLNVQWAGLEPYKADLEKFRQGILDRYSTMIQQLLINGHLTPEQAVALAKPNLRIDVDDRRSNRTPLE